MRTLYYNSPVLPYQDNFDISVLHPAHSVDSHSLYQLYAMHNNNGSTYIEFSYNAWEFT